MRSQSIWVYILVGLVLLQFFSTFYCKRADVSWGKFLSAGPFLMFRPSQYLRSKLPAVLFWLMMAMGLAVWVFTWGRNNL